MKVLKLRIVICLIIAALAVGSFAEVTYAANHEDCSCCKSKSHNTAKCHETAKICLCSFQINQIFIPTTEILIKLDSSSYSAQNKDFIYLYLSTKDIFHPPKFI